MTGLNHVATGITIALLVRRPEYALPLAFISHFILDTTPHSYVPMHRKRIFSGYIVIEAVAMTALTAVCMMLFPDVAVLLFLSAIAAFLPDFLWPFYYNGMLARKPFFKSYYSFHFWIQWSETYRGWFFEALYFSVLLIFIFTQPLIAN